MERRYKFIGKNCTKKDLINVLDIIYTELRLDRFTDYTKESYYVTCLIRWYMFTKLIENPTDIDSAFEIFNNKKYLDNILGKKLSNKYFGYLNETKEGV